MIRPSDKAARFTESVIREMTRLAEAHGAINLAQGFPDFPAPEALKEAACRFIREDRNQYAITWGAKPFRDALAQKYGAHNGMSVDPETMITVCCGSTEAMISALLATINPGDEIVVLEPFYENYGPDTILCGAVPRFVRMRPPDWTIDERELAAAFTKRTRGIIINTPNNPTGKVFTRAELELIADLCRRHDALAFTDEVYEHIVYDGARHVSIASLDGMAERTLTISALSKTFSVTGWRLGYVIAPPSLTGAVRKVHDFLTVGAPHPLQLAAAHLLRHGGGVLEALGREYQERRDLFYEGLAAAGLPASRKPLGAYYVMVDIGAFGFPDDTAFARWMCKEVGVAAVPGSSFYVDPRDGARQVRFCFCKKLETLREANRRLAAMTAAQKR
jgi:aminotransferase